MMLVVITIDLMERSYEVFNIKDHNSSEIVV